MFYYLCQRVPDGVKEIISQAESLDWGAFYIDDIMRCGNAELKKCLIDRWTEIGDEKSGIILLNRAIENGDLDSVKFLVNSGVDINKREYETLDSDAGSGTAVHAAAYSASTEILQYLLENGGDPSIKNEDGKLPYYFAEEAELADNMKLLE